MIDIKTNLKDYDFVGVGRDNGKNQGEYSAIFYDKNKLEVTKSGTFWLSETPEKPSKGWDAAYNRVCTYAFFKIKKTGKQFLAMNLHFDHVGDVARVNSAKLILEKIKEFDKNAKVVIISADIQKLSMDKALQLGAFNFIKKPIDLIKMQQILNKINELDN